MPSSMDYISSGMVSEDFGIEQKPACMVFLHLNFTQTDKKSP